MFKDGRDQSMSDQVKRKLAVMMVPSIVVHIHMSAYLNIVISLESRIQNESSITLKQVYGQYSCSSPVLVLIPCGIIKENMLFY